MDLKKLLDENKYKAESIYYGLLLDLSFQMKELMKKKGISKKEVAKKMGISLYSLNEIFAANEKKLNLETLAKFLSVLRVEVDLKLSFKEEEEEIKTWNIIEKIRDFSNLNYPKEGENESSKFHFVA